MARKTRNYARDYRILEDAAEKLRSGDLSDIDDLIATVEKATKAHRNCRDRLDAVELMLGEEDEP